jgi:hypothetical protein
MQRSRPSLSIILALTKPKHTPWILLKTGDLHFSRPKDMQSLGSPLWRSKRPAQPGGIQGQSICHEVLVASTERRSFRKYPNPKGPA